MEKRRNLIKSIDYKLLIGIIVLCIFGLVVLSSATLSLDGKNAIMRSQRVATFLGFGVLLVLMIIDYRHWKYLYKLIYIASLMLLVATLIFGRGPTPSSEIRSWISIGGFSFQPSEFVKIAFIISLASYLEEVKEKLNQPLTLFKVLVFAFLPIGLILMQPDTGTALVYIFITILMLFIAGIHWKYIVIAFLILLILAPIFWFTLEDYQKNRFFDFLNPDENPTGTNYQYLQGRIAIGSGQLLGKGLYQGTQNQFNFIPEKQNDFIFPVLAEELGFVGGLFLLGMYLFLLLRLYKVAKESIDLYGTLLVVGVSAMFLFHIWENVGMTLGLMPITGIPLPFLSAGGTFQLTNLTMIGLALSVAAHRKIKYF